MKFVLGIENCGVPVSGHVTNIGLSLVRPKSGEM
jgi:hypothetical protein